MAGTLGKGTTIGYGSVQGGPFTQLSKVRGPTMKAPGKKVGSAETTCYDDTSEQFIPGFLGASDGDTRMLYVTANYSTWDGMVGTVQWFEITLPDTHTIIFNGWIEEIGPEIPLKEAIVFAIKLKITGTPTYT